MTSSLSWPVQSQHIGYPAAAAVPRKPLLHPHLFLDREAYDLDRILPEMGIPHLSNGSPVSLSPLAPPPGDSTPGFHPEAAAAATSWPHAFILLFSIISGPASGERPDKGSGTETLTQSRSRRNRGEVLAKRWEPVPSWQTQEETQVPEEGACINTEQGLKPMARQRQAMGTLGL